MAEYIEREALMRNLNKFALEHLTPLIESLIQKQPSADVVEVVRCKNCIHLFDNGLCYFNIKGVGYKKPKPNDFCSYGERKDGDDNAE